MLATHIKIKEQYTSIIALLPAQLSWASTKPIKIG